MLFGREHKTTQNYCISGLNSGGQIDEKSVVMLGSTVLYLKDSVTYRSEIR